MPGRRIRPSTLPCRAPSAMRMPISLRALRDIACDHAVDADGREQQRHHAEDREQRGEQALEEARLLHHLVHGAHQVDGHVLVDRRHARAHPVGDGQRVGLARARHHPGREAGQSLGTSGM